VIIHTITTKYHIQEGLFLLPDEFAN